VDLKFRTAPFPLVRRVLFYPTILPLFLPGGLKDGFLGCQFTFFLHQAADPTFLRSFRETGVSVLSGYGFFDPFFLPSNWHADFFMFETIGPPANGQSPFSRSRSPDSSTRVRLAGRRASVLFFHRLPKRRSLVFMLANTGPTFRAGERTSGPLKERAGPASVPGY